MTPAANKGRERDYIEIAGVLCVAEPHCGSVGLDVHDESSERGTDDHPLLSG